MQQYEKGLIYYQPLLDSERLLVQQQDTLTESRGLVATDLVAIYKALAGGWETRLAVPTQASATAVPAPASPSPAGPEPIPPGMPPPLALPPASTAPAGPILPPAPATPETTPPAAPTVPSVERIPPPSDALLAPSGPQ